MPQTLSVDKLKILFWGLLFLIGGYLFWHSIVGNPINELALIRRAETAPGSITDSMEGDGNDRGKTHFFHRYAYAFRLPSGQTFTGETLVIPGRLPADTTDIQIEYLPDDPSINRIKGEGSSTVRDWFLRSVCGGGILLLICLAPGISVIHGEFFQKFHKISLVRSASRRALR